MPARTEASQRMRRKVRELTILGGVFGLVVQNIVPRQMLEKVPAETIYSQIGHILDQYRSEAEKLIVRHLNFR